MLSELVAKIRRWHLYVGVVLLVLSFIAYALKTDFGFQLNFSERNILHAVFMIIFGGFQFVLNFHFAGINRNQDLSKRINTYLKLSGVKVIGYCVAWVYNLAAYLNNPMAVFILFCLALAIHLLINIRGNRKTAEKLDLTNEEYTQLLVKRTDSIAAD